MTKEHSQFSLLRQHRFAPFFWTQFCGAANDNIYKFACTLLVTYQAAQYSDLPASLLTQLIAGLFILPFVLFSATSGQLADKYERSHLIRMTKLLELGIVLLAIWGFWQHSMVVLLCCIFLLGLQASVFGPVKYAYLPQHLLPQEIIGGNGLVESGTFIAILLGTMLSGALMSHHENGTALVSIAILAVALIGLAASWRVPHSPAPDPALRINWNPFTETWNNIQLARQRRTLFLSMLGISWLWFFGATLLTQFPGFAKNVLGGNEAVVTLLLAIFSIGVGAGALLCERLSGHKVEIGLVPFGSIGMSVFALDLYFASQGHAVTAQVELGTFVADHSHWRVMIDLFLLSLFSGLYSVPLYALIQTRCPVEQRARIVAANNILNALFMVVSAALAAVCLTVLKFSIPQLFLLMAVLNAGVAIYIYGLVPEFLLRFLAWLLVHSVYTMKKRGLEHIPDRGAALLVCNHVSFADPVVLMGISPRPIRFVMDYKIFSTPFMSWFFRQAKVIPIASAKDDPVMMEQAFAEVSSALRNGDLVMIFPEGGITRDGTIQRFRPGVTRVLESDPVPVIPLALCGLWGSVFSRHGGSLWARLRSAHTRIAVHAGPPIEPSAATPEYLQQRVGELRGDWQ
ncbi:MAG: MFS transporter [Burkholderiaceae bacterium]|nr:MAG: MFS transporter [Burkholderiaceae bacterium]